MEAACIHDQGWQSACGGQIQVELPEVYNDMYCGISLYLESKHEARVLDDASLYDSYIEEHSEDFPMIHECGNDEDDGDGDGGGEGDPDGDGNPTCEIYACITWYWMDTGEIIDIDCWCWEWSDDGGPAH